MTETNLLDEIESRELFDVQQFNVYRRDRSIENSSKSSGGGVLIAVKQSYESKLFHIPNTESIECVCVVFKTSQKRFFIYCGYMPSYKPEFLHVYIAHTNAIEYLCSQTEESDVVLVCGDFNLSDLKWIRDEENPNVMVPVNVVTLLQILNVF